MICKYCGKKMRLDDVDYNFKGNQDNYWICDNCHAGAFEKIRYNKSVSVKFDKEDNIESKEDLGGVVMEDNFEKLADIIKEKEKLEAVVERCQIENNTLYEALIIACEELEDLDSTLYDLYGRLDYYYETKDRHEWEKEILERAEEETGE